MSTATDMLAKYIAAEAGVLAGQDVRWGDRRLVMADLAEIRQGRKDWQAAVNAEALASAGKSTTRIAYADFSGCRR